MEHLKNKPHDAVRVPFSSLRPIEKELQADIQSAIGRVLEKSWYIRGEEGKSFESSFASYIGVKHAVGCGNGLDAIVLCLRALGVGKGDEVLVPAHTFIATALAVSYVGARPVFVDVEKSTFNIDPKMIEGKITKKTRAIIPVHLYGLPCDMNAILNIARKNGLHIVEDCAQAHGACINNRRVGSFGNVSAFSFYPGKNLGALGDGGAVVTDNEDLAKRMRAIGNYGSTQKYFHIYKGMNSRLDELQAAVLAVKLGCLDRINMYRRSIADRYLKGIHHPEVELPFVPEYVDHVWHIFAIKVPKRELLKAYLENRGIECGIHYPMPIHLQGCYEDLGYQKGDFPVAECISETELSLPIYYGMEYEDVDRVIELINGWSA